jgi:hypothetical protein
MSRAVPADALGATEGSAVAEAGVDPTEVAGKDSGAAGALGSGEAQLASIASARTRPVRSSDAVGSLRKYSFPLLFRKCAGRRLVGGATRTGRFKHTGERSYKRAVRAERCRDRIAPRLALAEPKRRVRESSPC